MLNVYLIDTITLKTLASRDAYNEPTFTTSSILGKIDRKTRLVRSPTGEEVVAAALVYLPKTLTIDHGDTLTFDGREHSIIDIVPVYDFSSSHWEVSVT